MSDTTPLIVTVVSTGIAQATSDLNNFTKAAVDAEKSAIKLGDSTEESSKKQVAQWSSAMSTLQNASGKARKQEYDDSLSHNDRMYAAIVAEANKENALRDRVMKQEASDAASLMDKLYQGRSDFYSKEQATAQKQSEKLGATQQSAMDKAVAQYSKSYDTATRMNADFDNRAIASVKAKADKLVRAEQAQVEQESMIKYKAQTAAENALKASLDRQETLNNNFIKKSAAAQLRAAEEARRLVSAIGTGGATNIVGSQAVSMSSADGLAMLRSKADEATHALHNTGEATVGVRREMIVIAHEAVSGNFSRIPGSLMVLAERTTSLSTLWANIAPIFSLATLGIVAAVSAVLALGVAMYQAHSQAETFNNSIRATGNFAGLTMGQMNGLAKSLGEGVGVSSGVAHASLSALAATGQLTAKSMVAVGDAALLYSKISGKSAEDVISQFSTIGAGVVKWVDTMRQSYQFVTVSQREHIRALEDQGHVQEALQEAMGIMSEGMKRQKAQIDAHKDAWDKLKDSIRGVANGLIGLFQEDTFAAKAARDIVSIKNLKAAHEDAIAAGRNSAGMEAAYQKEMNARTTILSEHLNKDMDEQRTAFKESQTMQENATLNAAKDRSRALADRAKQMGGSADLEKAAVKAYEKDQWDLAHATNAADRAMVDSAEQRAASLARIHKDYEVKAPKADDPSNAEVAGLVAASDRRVQSIKEEYAQKDKLAQMDFKYHRTTADEEANLERTSATNRASAEVAEYQERLDKLKGYGNASLVDGQRVDNLRQAARDKMQQAVKEMDAALAHIDEQALDRRLASEDAYLNGVYKTHEEEITALRKTTLAQEKHTREIGLTKEQIELLHASESALAATRLEAEASAVDEILLRTDISEVARKAYEIEIGALREKIDLTNRARIADQEGSSKEAAATAAKNAEEAWKKSNKQIGDDLASAIVDGGGNGLKKLIKDFKTQFARMILNPIIAPISGGIASLMNPTAASASGMGGASGTSSLIGLAQTANSIYSTVTGGLTLAGGLGTGFLGSVAGGLTGAGVGSGLTSAAGLAVGEGILGVVGPGIAGAISTGMSAVAAALPWVGGALAVAAVLKMGFGHGERETTSKGIQGILANGGASGTSYSNWKEEGGWFTGDNNGTDKAALSSDLLNTLSSGFTILKASSTTFASNLNVSAASIVNYSKAFDIALTDKTEENQKAITAFFSGMGDDIATLLVPNIASFAKIGETASVTLQRLSETFTATNQIAAILGRTVEATFGSIGLSSDAARERLVNLSGSLSALGTKVTAYSTAFLTDAEKIAPVTKAVSAAMASLGLSSVITKEQFKGVVNGLNLTTEADAKLFMSLMDIAPAFAQVADYTDTAGESLKSFQKTILAFKDSLLLGSLSILTPMQKLVESQNQYEATLAKAKGGDTAAQSALQGSATAYLTASQTVNASGAGYTSTFDKVTRDLSSMDGSHAGGLVSVPFDGYRATLHKDETVVDAQATNAIRRYFGGQASNDSSGNSAALLEEIKALREEVAALRADQNQQTGAIISSNYDANDRNANKVVAGSKDVVWANNNKAIIK